MDSVHMRCFKMRPKGTISHSVASDFGTDLDERFPSITGNSFAFSSDRLRFEVSIFQRYRNNAFKFISIFVTFQMDPRF